MRAFLLQLPLDQPVASLDHLPDEAGVVVAGVKIAAAPQDEGLINGVLEAVVALLGDAVLVTLAPVDAGGLEPVMVQQGGVIVVQRPGPAVAYLVGEGRGIVRAHHLWDAAQLPEGVLKPLLQGQEGLSGGDLGVAPPRVAEDQLEQQVGMGLAGDGHPQGTAVGEVDLGLPPRGMLLGEVDLLVRAVQRPPVLQSSLQGAHLGGAEAPGVLFRQPLDNCRCPQPAGGIAPQQGLNLLFPNPLEGVWPGAPPALLLRLGRQAAPFATSVLTARSSRPWPPPFPGSFLPYASASTMRLVGL